MSDPALVQGGVSSLLLIILLLTGGCLQGTPSAPSSGSAPDKSANASPEDAGSTGNNQTLSRLSAKPNNSRAADARGVASVETLPGYAHLDLADGIVLERLSVVDPRGLEQVQSGNFSDGRLTVGFLEPGTDYALEVEARDVSTNEPVNRTLSISTPSTNKSWAASDRSVTIQPGVYTNAGTLNVVLRDAENETLYMFGAGHAAEGEGQEVTILTDSGEEFLVGEVVALQNEGRWDWSLVRIDQAARPFVDPSLSYWTGPTGVASYPDLEQGGTLCIYGNGNVYSLTPDTKPRCGSLESYNHSDAQDANPEVDWWATTSGGDSGAPIIHYDSGKIVGLETSGAAVQSTGMPICGLLGEVTKLGFDLGLVRAPYNPPSAEPYPPYPEGTTTFGAPGVPSGPACPWEPWT